MSRVLLWLALTVPLAWQGYRYATEAIFYGEFVHWTGDLSAQLLIATLAITPLRLTFPAAPWSAWLLLHRRDFGLGSALYAFAHTIVYLANRGDIARILEEAVGPGMLTGWLALLIFIPLALTSNNVSVRQLGRRWKLLHRTVYVAAVLTIAHWILTAFDPSVGYFHLALLAAILLLRAWQLRRRRREPTT